MRIRVNGIPAPQGSKRHVGNGVLVESSRRVKPWREAVRAETQRALEARGLAAAAERGEPVLVDLMFHVPRPASLPKRVLLPTRRPDLDKLVRSTLDGLDDGGAFADDAQIVGITASKHYARDDYPPGVTIYVQRADELEQEQEADQ